VGGAPRDVAVSDDPAEAARGNQHHPQSVTDLDLQWLREAILTQFAHRLEPEGGVERVRSAAVRDRQAQGGAVELHGGLLEGVWVVAPILTQPALESHRAAKAPAEGALPAAGLTSIIRHWSRPPPGELLRGVIAQCPDWPFGSGPHQKQLLWSVTGSVGLSATRVSSGMLLFVV